MRVALDWAHADGVDFFDFDWYYHGELSSDPYLNNALANYRKLPAHKQVGFALNYIDIDQFAVPPSEWSSVVDQWVTEDFLNPDYARVEGKPLLLIWDSVRFDQQFGGRDGVNGALETLRRAAIAHGLPGVFVVGSVFIGTSVDRVGWDYFAGVLAGERYDAMTANAYPAAAGERDGSQPYADLVAAGKAGWDAYAQRLGFKAIPTVMAGWDPRPWNETANGHLWWFERTPVEFSGFARDAIGWVAAHPYQQVDSRPLVLVMSWNELGEGEFLLPTVGDRFAYGQALAQAVGVAWAPSKHGLKVSVRGPGGRVRSTPAGIDCRRLCAASFDAGLQITFSAIARRGFIFRGWSGDCRGRIPTCTFLIEHDDVVRAAFRKRQ